MRTRSKVVVAHRVPFAMLLFMDMLAPQLEPHSSVIANYGAKESRSGETDCFLTFANQLVEEILLEYGIVVATTQACEAA